MSDGGFHEAQINNMEMAPVSKIMKETFFFSVFLRKIGDVAYYLGLKKGISRYYKKYLPFHF